jgi:TonB family protein
MRFKLQRLAAAGLLVLAQGAFSQTHAELMREQYELIVRASECDGSSRLCRSLRDRALRAGCIPPIVSVTFRSVRPIEVRARVTVAPSGVVQSVDLVQPSPHKGLDQAAIDSLMNCRVQVLEKDGQPVGSQFTVVLTFLNESTAIQTMD